MVFVGRKLAKDKVFFCRKKRWSFIQNMMNVARDQLIVYLFSFIYEDMLVRVFVKFN